MTANTLAKLAHGLADNVLTEAALAHRGPVLVAPAMNPRMWAHPATQANARRCCASAESSSSGPTRASSPRARTGLGRMAEPEEIARAASELLGAAAPLAGKRVLVTAGGTREPLDAVRFVGNRSSGRMGVALAEEARRRGAEVTLLAANLAVPPPAGVEVVETPTAADLEREALGRAADADLVLMAAAVADYRPGGAAPEKRPKDASRGRSSSSRPPDVLAALGARRHERPGARRLRGRDRRAGLERARGKLAQERRPRRLQRRVPHGHRLRRGGQRGGARLRGGRAPRAKAPKDAIAAAILDEVERLIWRA